MSDKHSPKPIEKFARVRVIKNKTEIGNFRYAANHIIEKLPIADAEYREGRGEVKILNIVP